MKNEKKSMVHGRLVMALAVLTMDYRPTTMDSSWTTHATAKRYIT